MSMCIKCKHLYVRPYLRVRKLELESPITTLSQDEEMEGPAKANFTNEPIEEERTGIWEF
jgi:hypothetical protein